MLYKTVMTNDQYTLPVASVKPDCFVSNKAKLCHGHLIKCVNFMQQVETETESSGTEELPIKSSTATSNKQPLIENYFSKPLSKKK
ncbi:7937_t:CDS:2 [Entrophospora sp. SA101]|nr:7937_t:CDS:2 [Entrophospora sp. SA101]CAJ0861823.1 11020_t:CDS:2 [Entrophospora sp. SA101]